MEVSRLRSYSSTALKIIAASANLRVMQFVLVRAKALAERFIWDVVHAGMAVTSLGLRCAGNLAFGVPEPGVTHMLLAESDFAPVANTQFVTVTHVDEELMDEAFPYKRVHGAKYDVYFEKKNY
jgi:hypothetical protein